MEEDPVECGDGSGETKVGGVGCEAELDRECAEFREAMADEGPGAEDAATSIMQPIWHRRR
jgi:hypothetical protein